MGGFNSVLHRLIRDGELSQEVPDHLWLDLDLSEHHAVVDSNDGAGHLRDNNHILRQAGKHPKAAQQKRQTHQVGEDSDEPESRCLGEGEHCGFFEGAGRGGVSSPGGTG